MTAVQEAQEKQDSDHTHIGIHIGLYRPPLAAGRLILETQARHYVSAIYCCEMYAYNYTTLFLS